jgi:[acyl-carrier-protein] S-malonyltransferase
MHTAFVFPGQGSQAVGMGKALAETHAPARLVFDEVDGALGQNLSGLMFDGPEAELTLTTNAQPALMAVSLAVTRVLEAEAGFDIGRDARFVAGHSLGEYSALAAAGALTITDAARLLRIRGEAMQRAVPVGEGAMAAIIGLDLAQVSAIATQAASDFALQGGVCQPANDNGGGQVVISGTKAAVERAMALAKAAGAKRALLLPVSAPFHSALMRPAADAMAAAFEGVEIKIPKAPLVANVSAIAIEDPIDIRSSLIAQVTGAVRWRESVLYMADQGVGNFVELGAGRILTGLIRRIVEGATSVSIGAPADVEAFKAARRD